MSICYDTDSAAYMPWRSVWLAAWLIGCHAHLLYQNVSNFFHGLPSGRPTILSLAYEILLNFDRDSLKGGVEYR